MKQKIGIDWDGATVRLWDDALPLLNFKNGTNHKIHEIDHWGWPFDHGYGEDFQAILDLLDERGWRGMAEPYDCHTANVISNIAHANDGVDIVTSNAGETRKAIRKWLNARVPNHEMINIITLGRDHVDSKAALDYDYLIDDCDPLAEEMARDWPEKTLILMDCPWNRHIDDTDYDNVIRAESWLDVQKIMLPIIFQED